MSSQNKKKKRKEFEFQSWFRSERKIDEIEAVTFL